MYLYVSMFTKCGQKEGDYSYLLNWWKVQERNAEQGCFKGWKKPLGCPFDTLMEMVTGNIPCKRRKGKSRAGFPLSVQCPGYIPEQTDL